jgi:hypothetical protein
MRRDLGGIHGLSGDTTIICPVSYSRISSVICPMLFNIPNLRIEPIYLSKLLLLSSPNNGDSDARDRDQLQQVPTVFGMYKTAIRLPDTCGLFK